MKKKVLILALAVALIAIVVGGSLAFFTAQDEAENTFTVGSVKIEIYENDLPTPEDKMSFGRLIPVANPDEPSEDGNYIPKAVDVLNTGENTAFVRVYLGIPEQLVGYLCLDLILDGWVQLEDTAATVEGVAYRVYTFDWTNPLEADEFTGKLLKGVYLGADVDLEEDDRGNLLFVRKTNGEITDSSGFTAHYCTGEGTYESAAVNVLVFAQGIQERNLGPDATAALNTGFGEKTNPWQQNG